MCCGRNRAADRAAAVGHVAAGGGSASTPSPLVADATTPIVFEHVGSGASTVHGAVSGTAYRFAAPGVRLRVDPRDRPGLLAVPTLRWVR